MARHPMLLPSTVGTWQCRHGARLGRGRELCCSAEAVCPLVPWLSCLSYGAWYFPSAELLPGRQHEPPLMPPVPPQGDSEAGSWTSITPPPPHPSLAACWGWGTQPGWAPSITVPSALAPGRRGTALPRLYRGAARLPGGVQVGTSCRRVPPSPAFLLAGQDRPGPAFPELSTFPGSPLPPSAPRAGAYGKVRSNED